MKPFRLLKRRRKSKAFKKLLEPVVKKFQLQSMLSSKGKRELQMNFEDQFKALVFFHLEEFPSGRALLQAFEQNDFARECVAPPKGIEKSAFFEAINTRGLDQLLQIFSSLVKDARAVIPAQYAELGSLVAIDGSFIDAVLSMEWADYRDGSKKAKAHIGFDINHGIPKRIFLTDGKQGERPFVDQIIDEGETGVMDRGYQSHSAFDRWQTDGKQFICRIKEQTHRTVIKEHELPENSIVFFDAMVLLGTKGVNQTEKELRLVGYKVDDTEYWVATSRQDDPDHKKQWKYGLK